MSLLADVRDMDCLLSLNPLRLGLGASVVIGADAILRRVLYRWCSLLGTVRHAPDLGLSIPLLDIGGATFSPADLAGLRSQLEKQARDEDFVTAATVDARLDPDGALFVAGAIRLTDGRTYPLALSTADARPVLLKLGDTSA
jgi:hypothetical protein